MDDGPPEQTSSRGLRADWLDTPRHDRLPSDRPDHDDCLVAHARAVSNRSPGYADPTTGLFVMTAVYLRDRGWCCDRGCRHCPYEPEPVGPANREASEQ